MLIYGCLLVLFYLNPASTYLLFSFNVLAERLGEVDGLARFVIASLELVPIAALEGKEALTQLSLWLSQFSLYIGARELSNRDRESPGIFTSNSPLPRYNRASGNKSRLLLLSLIHI